MNRYENYHKHSHESNIRTLDCIVKAEDYIKRTVELGNKLYFTTEHGWTGNYLSAYDLCKKNNLKMVYGTEAYIVENNKEKDSNNYHIIIIGKNKNAFYQLNAILSEANKTGFYYKPRIDIDLLLTLNPNDFYITSACVAGFLRDNDCEKKFLKPILNHFGNNLFLEVQSHPHQLQSEHNKKVLILNEKYKIQIIHANDSHYIFPEQAEDRYKFLRGKGINYPEEDGFILDFPDVDTIIKRYKQQNILNDKQVQQALENTLIFDDCEDLNFNKEIKMPKLYPNEDSNKKLKEILNAEWKRDRINIPKAKWNEHIEAIRYETDIVEKTNMADYFILDYEIVKRAKEVYGGVLSHTGRGSAVSFYINKLLGFTEIDRMESPITLYPTRFMSITRILESRSLPDIDMNWSNVEPVIKASKDILGEDGIYYMIALGTMKESSAFRNLCRYIKDKMEDEKEKDVNGKAINNEYNKKVDEKIKIFNEEYNEVGKNLELYYEHPKWKDIIEESKKFIGVIENVSPSPCSFLLLDKPISKEIGLIRVGDEICTCIDGITADTWKYLKNDYLVVSVWDIISKTFELIGKPIPNIRELDKLLDDKVWKLYKDGITATLNQADSDFATPLFKKYAPKSIAEISAMVAAIRPGFASLLNTFLNREEYSTGVNELDNVLQDSFCFMMYQESIMKYLVWLGVPEEQTYDIVKKIAKKKFKEKELEELKVQLLKGWLNNVGKEDGFEETWKVVENSAFYSFNASHSLSVALDSIYGAYLKANYPLEYYTVILNMYASDTEKTGKIIQELPYFNLKLSPIKFRFSKAEYAFNKENNTIYKSISSIKYMNNNISNQLYGLGKNQYDSFVDLLIDITENTNVNTRQLNILISLNYFEEFGKNKYLLDIFNIFNNKYKKTYVAKTKEKRIVEIKELIKDIKNESLPMAEQFKLELEYLGYMQSTYEVDDNVVIVTDIDLKYSPKIKVYYLNCGVEEVLKIYKKTYQQDSFEKWDMLKVNLIENKLKSKLVDGKWIKSDGEYDRWLTNYIRVV